MFIDASALVGIINRETDHEALSERINSHSGKFFVSPIVKFEATTEIARSRSGARRPDKLQMEKAASLVDRFCDAIKAKNIDITNTIGDKAIEAASVHGKMVGAKADLNFGDCFSYACTKAFRLKLLYKGNDFSETDIG